MFSLIYDLIMISNTDQECGSTWPHRYGFVLQSQELVDRIASTNPFGRLGKPEEIASAIAYLCGEGGSWVNGQILRVNGGMTVG
jgi:NAD(P)-dependent dehydrogenase (short-subunit alcohol dehydrogenase family)